MRILVAGATGEIGRRAVVALVAEGHHVTGVARAAAKASLLRTLGAQPCKSTSSTRLPYAGKRGAITR